MKEYSAQTGGGIWSRDGARGSGIVRVRKLAGVALKADAVD
eukprot:CAMPEP_0172180658 /NCGR_PEP_ID=MMETSP1050-20130122/17367_1 /TAXON_ID=233186 /ORGANISM="Cryptomonas curvata, Strain CCAP979/52" /LENGTH=40 /DNA_ID= /DNA_START= /DNA_END= /DNA_ORIENTATION=